MLTSMLVPERYFFHDQFYKIHFNKKKMTLRIKEQSVLVLFFSSLAFFTHSEQFHNIKNKPIYHNLLSVSYQSNITWVPV